MNSSTTAALRLTLACAATMLFTSAAHATLPITYVSATGNDASTCARATPCKTFAGTLAKTDAGGEVVVLTAGEYGIVDITKSVRITAVGVYAGIEATVAGGSAVTVNVAPADVVVLKGLTLVGGGGAHGISYTAGGTLHVEGCTIDNFKMRGINFVSGGRLSVTDTFFRNNTITGIYVAPAAGTGVATVTMDHCRVEKSTVGVVLQGASGAPAKGTVRDSVVTNSGRHGYYAFGGATQLNVVDSVAVHSAANGFVAQSGAKINAQHCVSSNNGGYGFIAQAGGAINARDCTAANNAVDGMHSKGSLSRLSVEGCELTNNLGSGLYVSEGGRALISNTMATRNDVGLRNDVPNPGTLKSFGNNRVHDNITVNTSGTITAVAQL